MTKIRDGLANVTHGSRSVKQNTPVNKLETARVYAVILDEKTPSEEIFKKFGGWNGIGTILYLDYEKNKDKKSQDINVNDLLSAKPLFPNQKQYPLLGEIVLLFTLPSVDTQIVKGKPQKYYVTSINLWNNIQHNAQVADDILSLGKRYIQNPNVTSLQQYEGDITYEGRNGNGIRLGSSTNSINSPNTWSSNSINSSDPIVIIGNGYDFNKEKTPHIENINKDQSSLYLTSTQNISILHSITVNSIVNPILPEKYNKGQFIGVGDRVVLSSKTDDVLILGKTSINLYGNNYISLTSSDRIIFDSSKIYLGLKIDNDNLPDVSQPVMLGGKTNDALLKLAEMLGNFASALSTAISSPTGAPLFEVQNAAIDLATNIDNLRTTVLAKNELLSDTVFIKK